jgi:putative restriction endonuclease
MQRFWWVNHKQTGRQEVEGQYLWSPKREQPNERNPRGARSQFYDNMRNASPGDMVLSYIAGEIRFVGRVAEFAFTAPKPAEFGKTGSNWSNEGWLLPVYWTALTPPVRPKDFLSMLAPLLPKTYSPIQPDNGNGNQKAYLTEVDQAVFNLISARTDYDHRAAAIGGANSLTFDIVNGILDDQVEREIANDISIDDTVRKAIISARRGQGKFRRNVEAIEPRCRLTGIKNPNLLIASHIKPWRICDTAHERLDGMNGLLLTPDADLLFDRGYITFGEDADVLVSSRVDRYDLRRLGFDQLALESFGFAEAPSAWNKPDFAPEQQRYLAYHRTEVFVG